MKNAKLGFRGHREWLEHEKPIARVLKCWPGTRYRGVTTRCADGRDRGCELGGKLAVWIGVAEATRCNGGSLCKHAGVEMHSLEKQSGRNKKLPFANKSEIYTVGRTARPPLARPFHFSVWEIEWRQVQQLSMVFRFRSHNFTALSMCFDRPAFYRKGK